MPDTTIIGLIVLLAATIQGIAGFAFALVAMGMLTRMLPFKEAVALVSVFGFLTSLTQTGQLRGHIDRAKITPLLIGMVVGTPIGLAFLQSTQPQLLKISLGSMLIAYALFALSGRYAPTRPVSDRWGLVAGLAGGVLGGAFSTSGPPVVVYTTAKQWDKDGIKSSLAAFFTVGSMLQMALFTSFGLITWKTLRLNLILAPMVLIGLFIGTWIYDRIDHARFQQVVLLLLLILGLSYLVN